MTSSHDEWEKKLQDSIAAPISFPLDFLKAITRDFSSERELGRGGYGVVYKGVLRSGKILAVKKLFDINILDDTTFRNEVLSVVDIKHQHVVQFIGYCAETSWDMIKLPGGNNIWAETPKRLLCFEHVCNKSLDRYISDKSLVLDWNMRYDIIKGICSGLNFLHEECRTVHLDLKPENILMDAEMIPKIGDFGLSKIFFSQQSRIITNNRAGSHGYMAPEYLLQGIISRKADIFSVGVIIIEIITGHKDYPYFQLDSPRSTAASCQHFIEKVLGSWKKSFESTLKYTPMEKYMQQVKQCVSVALKCVNPDMVKRPTGKDIIQALNAVDQVRTQTSIMKFGLWGGDGGAHHDLEVLPQRLISVVVHSGKVIDSLSVTYYDFDGKQRTGGSWGDGPADGGSIHTILLGPSEFLLEVNGTIGPSPDDVNDVVSSIMFVTNTGSYGPFGEGGGTKFYSPVWGNGSIVGLYANAGRHLHAIGVYYNHERETMRAEAWVARVGPWGGNSGWRRDIEVVPQYLNNITIRSGEVVVSLAFSYSDDSGKQRHAGIWGSYGIWGTWGSQLGGTFDTIQLAPSEFLTGISGTVGLCSRFKCNVVTSLNFISNARTYGPFGGGKGVPFHSPVVENTSIVGFFAHATAYVDAVGVYLKKAPREALKPEAVVMKIGPWGGHSWGAQDVEVLPRRLISVVVHSGNTINSLEYKYSDSDGQERTAGPWGEGALHDGSFHTIRLAPSEILKEVSGTIDTKPGRADVITSLSFVANAGTYGPFGDGGGSPFRSPLQGGNRSIVGFFAHIDQIVVGIGVYVG